MYPSLQQVSYPQVVVYPQNTQYQQPTVSATPIQETKKRKYNLADKFPQGITLSWSVDAYVEKSVSLIEKLKKCCGKKAIEQQAPQNPIFYDPRLGPYQQQHQIQEPENPNIKQILRKGRNLILNMN